jgi:NAD(P)-dependent dehydrogenase (short-subunit alcohol dehydrogenase family)
MSSTSFPTRFAMRGRWPPLANTLSGRRAAVTGASRGIGRATALALSREGCEVFALARSASELDSLAAVAPAGKITPLLMDVADGQSRDQAVQRILTLTGGQGPDIVINNAGYGLLGPVEEIDPDAFRRQLEVNLVGALAFTQPFLPGMRERRRGWIVNISSAAGRISTPFMGAYSASKFALEALSDAWRIELSPFGVHVILIEPGPIQTDFGRAAVHQQREYSPYDSQQRRWHATRGATNLVERSPDAVARAVIRAIHARHPRPRYTVTVSAKTGTIARRLVPDIVLDWFFRRAIGA